MEKITYFFNLKNNEVTKYFSHEYNKCNSDFTKFLGKVKEGYVYKKIKVYRIIHSESDH